MEKQIHDIAVVIIGRNEGTRLVQCLNSVVPNGVPTIYVDSASNDDSIANATAAGIKTVKLDDIKPLSAARARNEGFDWFKKAGVDARYIHFIDGDCELAEHWLDKAVECLNNDETIGAVCGRLREKDRNRTIFTRLSDMGWYIEPGFIESCGGIVTIRSEIFEKLDGFKVGLIAGEEPEFYSRLRNQGYKILCVAEEMGLHNGAIDTFGGWFTRSIRTGFAYANAIEWRAWKKERRSLVFWGFIIPVSIFLSLFLYPPLSGIIMLLYFMQIFRIYKGLKIPFSRADRLLLATFYMIDKFSEFIGYMKYKIAKIRGTKQTIIEYK